MRVAGRDAGGGGGDEAGQAAGGGGTAGGRDGAARGAVTAATLEAEAAFERGRGRGGATELAGASVVEGRERGWM